MPSTFARRCLASLSLLFSLLFLLPAVYGESRPQPVTQSELMALVAGNALSENIVHEIQNRGLAFRLNEIYKTQLKTAGADSSLLAALERSKVVAAPREDSQTEMELVAHLANAGKLMRVKQFEAATWELTIALQAGAEAEAGFVMADLLRRQDQFDLAVRIFQKVLQSNPDFPEVHTKLAFVLYRAEDYRSSMAEAKKTLDRNPENAEAHKNMAISLMATRNFDPAIAEFREALRLKPDYAAAHFDMGIALSDKHDSAAAIAEYRKANALDPENSEAHYNLGILLKESGDTEGAIREYREAKRIDPQRIDARHNMALALADLDPEASIREYHELLAIAPNFQLAHKGLGIAFAHKGDIQAAEEEEKKAIALDPSDAEAHNNLAAYLTSEKKYDQALAEYGRALELDSSLEQAYEGRAKIYLERKDYADAIRECRVAERLNPASWFIHTSLGEALSATGDVKGAIMEMKQAQALFPQNFYILGKLAELLEKDGDPAGAVKLYRQIAEIQEDDKSRAQYAAAQKRLQEKISSLKAAGRQTEAADLEAKASDRSEDIESQWRGKMDECHRAIAEQRFDDAEKAGKAALTLAEQLRPVDHRLLQSIMDLAHTYTAANKLSEAQAQWQHGLSVAQQNFGPQSQEAAFGFEALAGLSYMQKDYGSSVNYYARAVEIIEKLFDATDRRVLTDLFWLGSAYEAQGSYDKAEPILLRVLQVNENGDKAGNPLLEANLLQLGKLYLAWGKFQKAEPYCRNSLAMREEWYGPNSAVLADPLQALSDVVAQLGRNEEAAQLRNRRQALLASTSRPQTKP